MITLDGSRDILTSASTSNPVHLRHAQIEQDHIGQRFLDQRQRLDSIAGFGDNDHVRLWFHVCHDVCVGTAFAKAQGHRANAQTKKTLNEKTNELEQNEIKNQSTLDAAGVDVTSVRYENLNQSARCRGSRRTSPGRGNAEEAPEMTSQLSIALCRKMPWRATSHGSFVDARLFSQANCTGKRSLAWLGRWAESFIQASHAFLPRLCRGDAPPPGAVIDAKILRISIGLLLLPMTKYCP